MGMKSSSQRATSCSQRKSPKEGRRSLWAFVSPLLLDIHQVAFDFRFSLPLLVSSTFLWFSFWTAAHSSTLTPPLHPTCLRIPCLELCGSLSKRMKKLEIFELFSCRTARIWFVFQCSHFIIGAGAPKNASLKLSIGQTI
jgi:hypothetical protein